MLRYKLDRGLASALARFFAGSSVIEFGAGHGCYSDVLRRAGRNISVRPFDGAPGVGAATRGFVRHADLSRPLRYGPSDWVLCLEMAEHVPRAFEAQLLANWDAHSRIGLVISWSMLKGVSNGHVNIRPHESVTRISHTVPSCALSTASAKVHT